MAVNLNLVYLYNKRGPSVCSDIYLLPQGFDESKIVSEGGAWHEEENGDVVGPLRVDQGQVSVPQVPLQGQQGC